MDGLFKEIKSLFFGLERMRLNYHSDLSQVDVNPNFFNLFILKFTTFLTITVWGVKKKKKIKIKDKKM